VPLPETGRREEKVMKKTITHGANTIKIETSYSDVPPSLDGLILQVWYDNQLIQPRGHERIGASRVGRFVFSTSEYAQPAQYEIEYGERKTPGLSNIYYIVRRNGTIIFSDK
jgi:hypothetical protein